MFLIIYLHCHVCHFLAVNIPLRLDKGLHNVFRSTKRKLNSPVSNSSGALNRITEDSLTQGLPRPKVNIFTNSNQKKNTCIQLCLFF